jgi:hypothetical protein
MATLFKLKDGYEMVTNSRDIYAISETGRTIKYVGRGTIEYKSRGKKLKDVPPQIRQTFFDIQRHKSEI